MARCVGDIPIFESCHWGRAPLLRRAESVDRFSDVFTAADLDAFLGSGLRRPIIRLIENGSPLPGERYTGRVRLGGSEFRDVVDPDRVAECFAAGTTVVAQSLHRTHPKVRAFTERLGREISHPLQANAYLTPPEATGLAPHADGHDVIVLQLEGSKCWSVEPLGEFELGPGDSLYVPAGHRHAATSNDESSLHVTLGILRVTYRSVLSRLLRDGPSSLDDPLPLRYRTDGTDDDLESRVAEMIDGVQRHLGSLEPVEIGRSERSRRVSRAPATGSLIAAIRFADVGDDDELVPGGGAWSVSRPTDSTVRVEADGQWLTAPSTCAPAIRLLAHGGTVRIDRLPGLDPQSRLILARRLLAAGFCRFAGM